MLTTNGTWHKTEYGSQFQQFKTSKCKTCPVREKCTSSVKNGKIVQRRKYAKNIEDNLQRIDNDKDTYRKRQAIVEHPYGTIKRQWGFSYIITKRFIERASADVGFMMTAYNLKRLINILGKEFLMGCFSFIYAFFISFRGFFRHEFSLPGFDSLDFPCQLRLSYLIKRNPVCSEKNVFLGF
ncbi:MAG: transposase [Bacteroidota bacterium]